MPLVPRNNPAQGRREKALTREPGDLPGTDNNTPSGVTARREDMTTNTQTRSALRFVPAVFAAVLGLAVISLTGHVQAAALHDAAHDVRHATGFPCH